MVDPQFLMEAIYGTGIDTRGAEPGFVSGTSDHWGPGVYYSDDRGVSGPRLKVPPYASRRSSAAVSSGSGKSSQAVPGDPDVIYAGTAPSRRCFAPRIGANRSASSGRCGTTRIDEEGWRAGDPLHTSRSDRSGTRECGDVDWRGLSDV